MNVNNNFDLLCDVILLLVVLWVLIVLFKCECQLVCVVGDDVQQQDEMFYIDKFMLIVVEVSLVVFYMVLLVDFGNQFGKKMCMDINLCCLEVYGFIVCWGVDIVEGFLLDLLLDYDVLVLCIFDGVLGDVLVCVMVCDEVGIVLEVQVDVDVVVDELFEEGDV